MIPLGWNDLKALELGELRGVPGDDGLIQRIHADSRIARRGDLFVALNTGVRFVDDALGRGAIVLVPRDQFRALADLAGLVRSASTASVVAVVGSTGKTSTKDALGALCAAVTPTVAAEASQNNEIGLPLTVLRLEPETRVLVTEMGMRGLGQIAELCRIARPDVALVTSIGPEHLELVGTEANVARANAEAIEALPAGGVAVVPTDAPELEPFLSRTDIDLRRFDRGSVVRVDGCRWRFVVDAREVELDLPFDQRHMAENVLAALTAYHALGLPLERAQDGAREIRLSPWRSETIALPGGGAVINDAYNANPTSMKAAVLDLVERTNARGARSVAVLGEMAELGVESPGYHAEIGRLLAEEGVDVLVAVGQLARLYASDQVREVLLVPEREAALDAVRTVVRPGDVILVKASRATGLEGIAGQIAKIATTWADGSEA
jgi:UDP-N-acetylmuramoyl-tripeptide--D-alanyl-D-alanine ligase